MLIGDICLHIGYEKHESSVGTVISTIGHLLMHQAYLSIFSKDLPCSCLQMQYFLHSKEQSSYLQK